ncbi:adenosine receptor A3-like [Diadema antillarum]|uniref:adenosine receptor A3-like n=1 Tax=Diadema antillarum TaxID=105358 RepID=UPI003A898B3B
MDPLVSELENDTAGVRHGSDGNPRSFIVSLILQVLVCTWTIVANGLVLATVCGSHRLRSVTTAFLISLAVADFLLGLSMILGIVISHSSPPYWSCLLVYCILIGQCVASIWSLVGVALDRYLHIAVPSTPPCIGSRSHSFGKAVDASLARCWGRSCHRHFVDLRALRRGTKTLLPKHKAGYLSYVPFARRGLLPAVARQCPLYTSVLTIVTRVAASGYITEKTYINHRLTVKLDGEILNV